MAGAGLGRLPLRKFVIRQDGESKPSKRKREDNKGSDEEEQTQDADEDDAVDLTPSIPTCLKQEYIFMPSRVRDAYLLTTIRTLIANGGRHGDAAEDRGGRKGSGWTLKSNPNDEEDEASKARSAIVFVSTCERAALVSTILRESWELQEKHFFSIFCTFFPIFCTFLELAAESDRLFFACGEPRK